MRNTDVAPQLQEIDYANIQVKQTTTTTVIRLDELPKTDYQKLYEELLAANKLTTTSTSTSTTTTSETVTTTTHKPLKNILPTKVNIKPEWRECEHDRDCVVVSDCCGIGLFGRKYTINEHFEGKYYEMMKVFCAAKDHRIGCGWQTPYYGEPVCSNGTNSTCVFTYESGFNGS